MCCEYLSACVSSPGSYVLAVNSFHVSDSILSVQQYHQANSGIEGRRRLNHTINRTFGYS
ncbi:hypothetical protein F383_23356 [Gossypium arboreum]|uniref:Uncharacterized protein n=1 Tax=Gossypium arboreum TaxID=29729 RepID=A0A0B0NZV0_GOSAR|nr:hypothetical protein F383_23356 [Gossypium arboreum]